jgi:EamA-like transporter family.
MLAVQHLGPNRTSIFMNLMPVFTAIIAYFWLAEQWMFYHTCRHSDGDYWGDLGAA